MIAFVRCALLLALVACGRVEPGRPGADGDGEGVTLRGAGATLPRLLIGRWSAEFSVRNPSVEIQYQPIGSRHGMDLLRGGTVDFAVSEMTAWTDSQRAAPRPLVEVPLTVGAIAVVYHLPESLPGLRMTPEVLDAIYAGRLTFWDDPRLRALNPGARLPHLPVRVVGRADGSGTAATFFRYVSSRPLPPGSSPEAVGEAASSSEGVAARVRLTQGTIGYVHLTYAEQLGLAVAAVRNVSGRFVLPTVESVSVAASDHGATAAEAYPIVTYSYLLVDPQALDDGRRATLTAFLRYCVGEGQGIAPGLHHPALPAGTRAEARRRIAAVAGRPGAADQRR